MKKFVLLVISCLLLLVDARAFDPRLLANNKEAISRELSARARADAEVWASRHRLGRELRTAATKTLSASFKELERIETTCDLGLVDQLFKDAERNGVVSSKGELLDFAAWIRAEDLIDDIFYKLLRDATVVRLDFENNAALRPGPRPLNLLTRQNANVDLVKFFEPVKTWPDDVKSCSLETYFKLTTGVTAKNANDRDGQMLKLHHLAYRNGVISLETFNRLETLRKRAVLSWPIYFKRYADVINNAKDKLTKTPEARAETNFTVEYVSRRDGVTKRENLFQRYNSTQIVILAQIIEKSAKRMDAKRASINWQYTDDPNGETEIYVLSPMEQYRAAIKMLRKDLNEVMRSEAFIGKQVEYEHLIAAAYETGYIKSEELALVIKFEEFWNPNTPKWRAYANFAFSLAGTASFYLPPPWNIIGAIGLVLTQTKLMNGEQRPNEDDNGNVII
jgi:hypothetical protein